MRRFLGPAGPTGYGCSAARCNAHGTRTVGLGRPADEFGFQLPRRNPNPELKADQAAEIVSGLPLLPGAKTAPAYGADGSPAAFRSRRRWLIWCSVASISGSRIPPTGRPCNANPALTRMAPWVRKMPV